MMQSPLLALGTLGAAAVFLVSARRPALGCALLALGVPLAGGLARGAVLPFLRISEALVLVVAAGLAVHLLPRRRRAAYIGIDVVVFAFCLASVLLPWAVLTLGHASTDLEVWRTVAAPLQYLAVYLLFSRAELSESERRLVLNLAMLASLPVAAVAVVQFIDLAGLRDAIGALYPSPPLASWERVYRPTSLLGHYSALGAYGLLNFTLALALAASRSPGFPAPWLTVVMGVNLVSLVAAQSYAPLVAAPVAAVAVVAVLRRIPWGTLSPLPLAGLLAAGVFWPAIMARLQDQQLVRVGSQGLALPETLQTRLSFWQGFFLPAYLEHGLWLGTGTLIPAEVPRPLVNFVDNGYLWTGFRAGLIGLALLGLLLGAMAALGWASSRDGPPLRQALGATCLASVAATVLLEMTSEYLTFTTVSQEFWMVIGLLAGLAGAGQAFERPRFAELRRSFGSLPATGRPHRAVSAAAAASATAGRRRRLGPELAALGSSATAAAAAARRHVRGTVSTAVATAGRWRRLAPEGALVRSSVVVFAGFALARLFSFLFFVAGARLLDPAGYGRMAYALAVATVAAVLLNSAPLGMARFLARAEGDRAEQEAYWANWLAVVGGMLGVSLAVALPVAAGLGLGGWMLVGVAANLVGMAVLETYRELQRGLGRYALQAVHYALANLLQLLVVVLAWLAGWRSAELLVIVYGLSSPAALVLLTAVRPLGLGLVRAAVSRSGTLAVLRFIRPVLLESVFYAVWFSGDLILVANLLGPAETGVYAAAKTIANAFVLVPQAISFVYLPRVARSSEGRVLGHLADVLPFTAAVTVPAAAALAVAAVASPLLPLVFGREYAAGAPLAVLVGGMALYGLRAVLSSLWLGLGHPVVDTIASGAGMAVLLATAPLLIPRWGTVGAAVAFTLAAAVQLQVAAIATAWALAAEDPRVRHFADARLAGEQRAEA